MIPKNAWFVFPVGVLSSGTRNLTLSPHLKVSFHGRYLEAWHLLRGEEAPVPVLKKARHRQKCWVDLWTDALLELVDSEQKANIPVLQKNGKSASSSGC